MDFRAASTRPRRNHRRGTRLPSDDYRSAGPPHQRGWGQDPEQDGPPRRHRPEEPPYPGQPGPGQHPSAHQDRPHRGHPGQHQGPPHPSPHEPPPGGPPVRQQPGTGGWPQRPGPAAGPHGNGPYGNGNGPQGPQPYPTGPGGGYPGGPQSFASGPAYPGGPGYPGGPYPAGPAHRASPPPPGGAPQGAPTQPGEPYGPADQYGRPTAAGGYGPPTAPPQGPQSYGQGPQSYGGPQSFAGPSSYPGGPGSFSAPVSPGPQSFGTPAAYGSPQPYGPSSAQPGPDRFGGDATSTFAGVGSFPPDPAAPQPPLMRQSYDTAVTQVFAAPLVTPGGEGGYPGPGYPNGSGYVDGSGYPGAMDATGVLGAYDGGFDDGFARGSTGRIDFGPHEAFGPPPSEEPEPEPDDSHVFSRIRRIRSHAQARRPKTWIALIVVLGLFGVGAGLRFVPGAPFYAAGPSTDAPQAAMPLHPADISAESLGAPGFVSWAYVDLQDHSLQGSTNMAQASPAGSVVTAWLGADFLRRSAEQGATPSENQLSDVNAMIEDNDESATERIVTELGDASSSFDRLVTICQLSDTSPVPAWQDLALSAQDAARLGACLVDGRAAGAEWTPTILTAMRQVRGQGDFGIRDAFPSNQRSAIAIKNGWRTDSKTGQAQVSCLAIGGSWSLAVLQSFPVSTSDTDALIAQADAICKTIAQRLIGS